MRSSPVSERQLVNCGYQLRRWAISAAVVLVLLGGSLVSVEAGSISAASAKSPDVSDPVSLVNPFIGTAGTEQLHVEIREVAGLGHRYPMITPKVAGLAFYSTFFVGLLGRAKFALEPPV